MIKVPRWKFILVILVTLAGVAYSFPNMLSPETRSTLRASLPAWMPSKAINLGLDLRGGTYLLLDAHVGEGEEASLLLDQSVTAIRKRLEALGAQDILIEKQDESRIFVQVPGMEAEQLKRIITAEPAFSFYTVDESENAGEGADSALLPIAEEVGRSIPVNTPAFLDVVVAANETLRSDDEGHADVTLRMDASQYAVFCTVSRENVGKPLVISFADTVVSVSVVTDSLCEESVGGFELPLSPQTAHDLALILTAGAMPVPLDVAEARTIAASYGASSIEAGQFAAVFCLLVVLVFMAFSYGLFGIMADVALLVNVALIIAILSALQIPLTMPGIAGIILTIGMAVDANVLIFERVREDLRDGRSLVAAVESGYRRAMSTVTDSHITTLIAALILYCLGAGPIQGFAVTLAIGVVTTLFSAIVLTQVMVGRWVDKHRNTTEMPV